MFAGHIGLSSNYLDLISFENQEQSGVYTLKEHFVFLNQRSYPLSSIFDDFKVYNKYRYIMSEFLKYIILTDQKYQSYEISSIGRYINLQSASYSDDDVLDPSYTPPVLKNYEISTQLRTLQSGYLSFYLHNPYKLDSVLEDCYDFQLNNTSIDLLSIKQGNPQSLNELFTHFLMPLDVDMIYTIKFIFKESFPSCISSQHLLLTNLEYPFSES